uniref:Uncharacterized protein n=1 Tax=Anopheles minimus TaxID=112268 RepID=A0A182VXK1_9DIPT
MEAAADQPIENYTRLAARNLAESCATGGCRERESEMRWPQIGSKQLPRVPSTTVDRVQFHPYLHRAVEKAGKKHKTSAGSIKPAQRNAGLVVARQIEYPVSGNNH